MHSSNLTPDSEPAPNERGRLVPLHNDLAWTDRSYQSGAEIRLKDELLTARQRIEALERLLLEATRTNDVFAAELETANRLAAAREKRLTIELLEAQHAQSAATTRSENDAAVAASAKTAGEDFRQRAEWAADERVRLARLYEDACIMATNIGRTVEHLEVETRAHIAAKDAEIHELTNRCAELQDRFLSHVEEAIKEARAESERLSRLLNDVQQGRFWGLKRAFQGLRRLVGGG